MSAPKKNTAFSFTACLVDTSARPALKANPTLASGDVKVSIDGGAFANLTTLPTVAPAGGRAVQVSLTAGEMNGDRIDVQFVDAAGGEWDDVTYSIQTSVNTVDEVKTDTAAVKLKTDNLPADPAGLAGLASAHGAGSWATATGFSTHSASDVWAVGARTLTSAANITSTGGTITVSAGAVTAGTVSDKTGYALTTGERDSIAAALLDLAAGVETGLTLRQGLRLIVAAEAGKVSGGGTSTVTIRNYGDTLDRIVGTVDANGNRSALTVNLG